MSPEPSFAGLLLRLRTVIQFQISTGVWTERALARHAGLSQPHLHQVLKGQKRLSVEMADRLREAMGIRVVDLLSCEDPLNHP